MAAGVTWRWSCVITFLTQLQYLFQKSSILCHKKVVFSFQKVYERFSDLYVSGFPDSSVGKESACNAGDPGLILGWEDSLEKATHSSILGLPLWLS